MNARTRRPGWSAHWRLLAPDERRCLLEGVFVLPLLRLGLGTFGYQRMRAFIDSRFPVGASRKPNGPDLTRAARLAAIIRAAGTRGPIRASCLPQSLFLYAWLRRAGFDPALRIGVRRGASATIEAHAWVELGGQALDPGAPGFSAFEDLLAQRKS